MATDNKKISILIVEDDEFQSKSLAGALEGEDFSVMTAPNGKKGLEMALEKKPDLILLDIIMPVMDGMAMLQELRKNENYGKNVPVILLTNLSADEEGVIQAIARDKPSYYLVKSDVTLQTVLQKIKEGLKQRA